MQKPTVGAVPDEITTTGLALLESLIRERVGLRLKPEKRDHLVRKLTPLAREQGATSFLAYCHFLRGQPTEGAAWQQVVEALVVRESRFWREMGPILALVQEVVPTLLRQNRGRPVRLWSAGCACGEEPYSLAIALQEAGLLRPRAVEVIGTDVNLACLQEARAARYAPRALRDLPSDLRERYFVAEEGGTRYRLREEIARSVAFRYLNLLDRESLARMAPVDAVLCRNVFIYLSPEAITRVLEGFHAVLAVPGYLTVAAAESLARQYGRFRLVQVAGTYLYQKEP
ncbi:MAG: CheR family methyltransferase [Anaerolineae bacterium]